MTINNDFLAAALADRGLTPSKRDSNETVLSGRIEAVTAWTKSEVVDAVFGRGEQL